MTDNTKWVQEALDFVASQRRKMRVVVCFDDGGRNEFGTVQSQDGDDVVVTVKGSLPTTMFTETTRRISADCIRDVVTELL